MVSKPEIFRVVCQNVNKRRFYKMAKHGKQLSESEKKTILALIESGMRARTVASTLNRSESTISKFLKRFREAGTIKNKDRSGRPKLFTDRDKRKLSKIVKADRRQPLRDITMKFNDSNLQPCSSRTIQRNLHSMGFKRRAVVKRMVVRKVNQKKRIDWCRARLHWTINNQWKHIIFSDEMMIVLKPDGQLKVWRKVWEKMRPECLGYLPECVGKTLKLMVWGCMTYTGMGTLAFIDGNMNSVKYIDILETYLWPVVIKHFGVIRWIFQEDNAPTHKSKLCEDWKRQNDLPVLHWPAQSPDLSPIENIWLLLKNSVKRNLNKIMNLDDLKFQLQHAWNNVPLNYIHNLYNSIPRRIRQVLIQKGHITKY